MSRCIWKFYWDCGRNGDLSGVFVATQDEINNAIGKRIYFGEVLGKHSEIYGFLEKDDVELLTNDQFFIDKVIEYGLLSGYNPLEYIEEEE